jgi:hypothetical protein
MALHSESSILASTTFLLQMTKDGCVDGLPLSCDSFLFCVV